MNFPRQIIPSLILSVGASLGLVNAPAIAFTITQNNNPNTLLNALLGSDPNNYKGLSNFNINLIGDARAFGTFTNDPFGLGNAVALSTGRVVDLAGTNTSDSFCGLSCPAQDLSTDLGLPGEAGDSISMILSFDADDTVDTLFFQYVFGSEEFIEFGGSEFNDSFSLLLNGVNYAQLSNGDQVNINNLAGSPVGPFSPDFIYNPVGTGPASSVTKLDGYTVPLLYNAPLFKGAKNFLFINVKDESKDEGDGIFDSAVFLKAGTFGTVCPVDVDCTGTGTTTDTTTNTTTDTTTNTTTDTTTNTTTDTTTGTTTDTTTGTTTDTTTGTTTDTTTGNVSVPEPGSSPISFLVVVLTFIGLAISRRQN